MQPSSIESGASQVYRSIAPKPNKQNDKDLKNDQSERITKLVCNLENYNNPEKVKEMLVLSSRMSEKQKKLFRLYSQAKENNDKARKYKEKAEEKMNLAKDIREKAFKQFKEEEAKLRGERGELKILREKFNKEKQEFLKETLAKVEKITSIKEEIRNLLAST